jgi:hypothetical protein
MAYQSHHCSATLPCSVCISVFCTLLLCFMFFCLLCSVCHVPSMHHSSSVHFCTALCLLLHTSITLNNNNNTHLFFILHTYSLCAPCACNMCHASACSHHANVLHIGVFTATPPCHPFTPQASTPLSVLHLLLMSSALPDHHCNSSASLAVQPMRPSSLGVMLRFLSLSGS